MQFPLLKLEDENFDSHGERQQLFAYCISAKLYCLYNLEGNRVLVRKPSGHGLGFLQAPYTIAEWQRKTGRKWEHDLSPWIYEAWHFILARELGLPHKPPRWLKYPAVMAAPISTPQVSAGNQDCFHEWHDLQRRILGFGWWGASIVRLLRDCEYLSSCRLARQQAIGHWDDEKRNPQCCLRAVCRDIRELCGHGL